MRKRIISFILISLVNSSLYAEELFDIRDENPVNLTVGDDQVSSLVQLPFIFNYYDVDFNSAKMSSNGCLSFSNTACQNYNPQELPYQNFIMYPLWTDLISINRSTMFYKGYNDKAIFGWYGISEYYDPNSQNNFEVILYNDNSYEFRYGNLSVNYHNVLIGSQGDNNQIDQRFWSNNPQNIQSIANTSFLFNFTEPEPEPEPDQTDYGNYADEDNLEFINQNIQLTNDSIIDSDISYSLNFDESQTGYDIFENIGVNQEDVIGFDPNPEPMQQIESQEQIINQDDISDFIFAEIYGNQILSTTEQVNDEVQQQEEDIIEQTEIEILLSDETVQDAQNDISDNDSKDKEDKNTIQQMADLTDNQTADIEQLLSIDEDSDADNSSQSEQESSDEQVAEETQAETDEMPEDKIQDSIEGKQEALAESGGFDDQSSLTSAIGYKKGFSSYTKNTLVDNNDWYKTVDVYEQNKNIENKTAYFNLIGLDSKHEQMVSKQYE